MNDCWGGSTYSADPGKRLQLAGPPYDAESGSFTFLLSPELKDGGLYLCEVFLNDVAYSRSTTLSVLKGTDRGRERRKDTEVVCWEG